MTKKKVEKKTVKAVEKEAAPLRIRMLMSLANSKQAFTAGQVYTAGVDLEPETAKSWLKSGVATEVTEEEGPEEIKEK